MIYGIGTDIVKISRVESALNRWGTRFMARVYTDGEIAYCKKKASPASRFAMRFAAKEAFAKALGMGFRSGLSFQQIEVIRNKNGAPKFRLHGKAQFIVRQNGIQNTFLSLSDDGSYALAFVILES